MLGRVLDTVALARRVMPSASSSSMQQRGAHHMKMLVGNNRGGRRARRKNGSNTSVTFVFDGDVDGAGAPSSGKMSFVFTCVCSEVEPRELCVQVLHHGQSPFRFPFRADGEHVRAKVRNEHGRMVHRAFSGSNLHDCRRAYCGCA